MTEPLVSVVLPTHDRAAWIERSVTSVLAQTHRSLELLVVDDGSTDGTQQVLEQFGSQLTVLAQPRAGAYAARNLAIRQARGEFVAFIDSDDRWLPHRLASQLPLMARPEVGLVFGDALHVPAPSHPVPRRGRTCFQTTPPRRGRIADHFAWGNFVPTTTVLVRRRCFDEVGLFSLTHTVSADYLKWFQIALRYELDYVDTTVADYTVHPEGISHDLGRSLRARIEIFSAELERTSDPATRRVLRRLLFNLSLHLGLAVIRRRAGSGQPSLGVARRTASTAGPAEAAPWTLAFIWNQARVRGRYLFGERAYS